MTRLLFTIRSLVCLLLLVQQPAQAGDYYWVGGTGNWSDITHWATTSGGNVQHPVIPSAADDVFFDANSFARAGEVVTVDNENVFCASIDWTGVRFNPIFRGAKDRTLNATGSVVLNEGMSWAFQGQVRLSGNKVGTLDFRDNRIKSIAINGGAAASWTLVGPLLVDSICEIFGGGLNTGGHNLRAEALHVWATSSTTLSLGASEIRLTGSIDPLYLDYHATLPILGIQTDNLTVDAGTSKIVLSGPMAAVRIAGTSSVSFYDMEFSSPIGEGSINYHRYRYTHFFDWVPPINSFRKIHFRCNGLIFGSHQTEILELAPGNQYRFESNRMVSIAQLIAMGTCDAPIGLSTFAANGPVELSSVKDQTVSYVSLRNCLASGGGTFQAENSADLGGNAGWAIREKTGSDLYWVGGEGNWSDPQHWSMSSGGPAGACVPFPTDNVFFDQNSFSGPDTVHLNTAFALCANMTWLNLTTNPILAGPIDHDLNIYGSLILHPNLDQGFSGDVNFLSADPGNVIDLAGKRLHGDVKFDGVGSWSLASAFDVAYYVYFLQGMFDTRSQPVILEGLLSEVDTDRSMRLGSSRLLFRTLRRRANAPASFNTTNLDLDAGTSLLEFSIAARLECYGMSNEQLRWHHIQMGGGNVWGREAQFSSARMTCADESYFWGKIQWDKLVLAEGHAYFFENQSDYLLEVDTLDALGSCTGTIGLSSRNPGRTVELVSTWDQQATHLELRDVHIVGATFTATSSIDYGNNRGWIIDDVSARELYWVGGTGAWEDPAHWSRSSGGPGGECVPTSIDNVFFDDNSFSSDDQYVETLTNSTAVCHNFVWEVSRPSIQFYRWEVGVPFCCIADFHIYGSLDIRKPFVNRFFHIDFRGDNREEYVIRTSGVEVNSYRFNSTGHRTLMDDWATSWLKFDEGGFKTNNHDISARQIEISSQEGGVSLDLDSSTIRLNHISSEFWAALHLSLDHNFSIDPGQSTVIIDNGQDSHVRWFGNHALHRLVFGSKSGRGHLVRGGYDGKDLLEVPISILEFKGDGIVYGGHRMDSLLFANGHAYVLESEKVQRVNEHIRIRGNNCIQLSLRSTESGNHSIIEMVDGEVNGDFIQMQDQIARGGASFLAGANSADVSNNQGWVFESKEEFVDFGLLGNDQIFCHGEANVVLNEGDLIGARTYLWSDGSTDAEFLATGPGKYFVDVSFTQGCVLSDTINLLQQDNFQIDLGGDQLLCEGESFDLNADLRLAGVIYRWTDGHSSPMRTLDSAGLYILEAQLSGCTTADSLTLDYVNVPDFAVELPPTLCLGDTIVLEVPLNNIEAEWNTGEKSNRLEVTQSGEYIATVSIQGCSDSDSISLSFIEREVFDLGGDTLLCSEDALEVDLISTYGDSEFIWADGVREPQRTIAEAGVYHLTSERMGCYFTDSIEVRLLEIDADLTSSGSLCQGDTVNLDMEAPGREVLWSTGSTEPQIALAASGTYWVDLRELHCNVRDSFVLDFVDPPELDLPDSISICAHDQVTMGMEIPGAVYNWAHGETTAFTTVSPQFDSLFHLTAAYAECAADDSTWILVKPLPNVEIDAPDAVCPQDSFLVTITSDGDGIFWDDGTQEFTRAFAAPNTFSFELDLAGCPLDTFLTVEEFATNFKRLPADTSLCDDDELLVDVEIPNATYTWDDGSNSGIRTLDRDDTYVVLIDDGNCQFVDSMTLSMRECVYFQAYAPNVFTPNNDGINDVFRIQFDSRVLIGEYLLQVHDRWGNMVFESTDPNRHWDGRLGDTSLPSQVYLWHISMQFQDDDGVGDYKSAGDVLLVR